MLCVSSATTTPTTGNVTTRTSASAITAPRVHHDHARHFPRIIPPLSVSPDITGRYRQANVRQIAHP